MSAANASASQWHEVCALDQLIPNAGVAALLGDQQVALFYLPDEPEQLFAIGNYDPLGDANVLSRGIVGNIGERLVVASPLYKQHFDLRTGECVEDDTACVPTFGVRINAGRVELGGS